MALPISRLPSDIESILTSNLTPSAQAEQMKGLLKKDPRWSVISSPDPRMQTFAQGLQTNYAQSMAETYAKDNELFKRRIAEAPSDQRIMIASLIFAKSQEEQVFTACNLSSDQKNQVFAQLACTASSHDGSLEQFSRKNRLEILLAVPPGMNDVQRALLKAYPPNPAEWSIIAKKRPEVYLSELLADRAPRLNQTVLCEAIHSSDFLFQWPNNPKLKGFIEPGSLSALYKAMIEKDPFCLLTSPNFHFSPDEKLMIADVYAGCSGHPILNLTKEQKRLAVDFLLDPLILDALLSNVSLAAKEEFKQSLADLRVEYGGVLSLLNKMEDLSAESALFLRRFQRASKDEVTPPDAQSWVCVGPTKSEKYRCFTPNPDQVTRPFPATERDPYGWRLINSELSEFLTPDPALESNSKIRNLVNRCVAAHGLQALGFGFRSDGVLMVPTIGEINRRLGILLSHSKKSFTPIKVREIADDDPLDVDATLIREAAEGLGLILSPGRYFLHDIQIHVLSLAVIMMSDEITGSSHLEKAKRLLAPLKETEEWLSQLEEAAKKESMNPADREFVKEYVPFWRAVLAARVDVHLTRVGILDLVERKGLAPLEATIFRDPNWRAYFQERFPTIFKHNRAVFSKEGFQKCTARLIEIMDPKKLLFE